MNNDAHNEQEKVQAIVKSEITAQQGGQIHIENNQTAHTINNIQSIPLVANQLPTIWGSPSLDNNQFFKTKDVEQVAAAFKNDNVTNIVSLVGLGGVGKTELARHYFYNNKKPYTSIIWFAANTRQDLELEYRNLAKALKLITEEEDPKIILRKIFNYLAEHPGWLLVLDNADTPREILSLIPPRGGDVLITSRQLLDKVNNIKIDTLPDEEAIHLYQHLTQEQNIDIVKKLAVENLGGLPLAIAQAAAYVNSVKNVDTRAYLDLFTQFQNELLSTNKLPTTSEDEQEQKNRLTVATTWNLSLSAINNEYDAAKKTNHAIDILNICAYLANKNIPTTLVENILNDFYRNKFNVLLLNDAIGELCKHSLIQIDKGFIHIHKLVHDVMKLQQPDKKIWFLPVAEKLAKIFMFKTYHADEISANLLLLPHCEEFAKHTPTDGAVDLTSSIKLNMANAYMLLNDDEMAKKILKEDLESRGINLATLDSCPFDRNNSTNTMMLKLMDKLGQIFLSLYKKSKSLDAFENSLLLLKKAKDGNSKIYGENSSQVAVSLCHLTLLIKEVDKLDCCIEILKLLDQQFPEFKIKIHVETEVNRMFSRDGRDLISLETALASEAFNNKARMFASRQINESTKRYENNVLSLVDQAIKTITAEDNNYEVFVVVRTLANTLSDYDSSKSILLQSALKLGLLIYGENSLIIAETKVYLAKCTSVTIKSIAYYLDALKTTFDILTQKSHNLVYAILTGLENSSRQLSRTSEAYVQWNDSNSEHQAILHILYEYLGNSDAQLYIPSCLILSRLHSAGLIKILSEDKLLQEKIINQLDFINASFSEELAEFFIKSAISNPKLIEIFIKNLGVYLNNGNPAGMLIQLGCDVSTIELLISQLKNIKSKNNEYHTVLSKMKSLTSEKIELCQLLIAQITNTPSLMMLAIVDVIIDADKSFSYKESIVEQILINLFSKNIGLEYIADRQLSKLNYDPVFLASKFKETVKFDNTTDIVMQHYKSESKVKKKFLLDLLTSSSKLDELMANLNNISMLVAQAIVNVIIDIDKAAFYRESITGPILKNLFSGNDDNENIATQQLDKLKYEYDFLVKKSKEIINLAEPTSALENYYKSKSILKKKILIDLLISANEFRDEFFIKIFHGLLGTKQNINTDSLKILSALAQEGRLNTLSNHPQDWNTMQGQQFALSWLLKHDVHNDELGSIILALMRDKNPEVKKNAVDSLLLFNRPNRDMIITVFNQLRNFRYEALQVDKLDFDLSQKILINWNDKNKYVTIIILKSLSKSKIGQILDFRFAIAAILIDFLKKDKILLNFLIQLLEKMHAQKYPELIAKVKNIATLNTQDANDLINDLAKSNLGTCYKMVIIEYSMILDPEIRQLIQKFHPNTAGSSSNSQHIIINSTKSTDNSNQDIPAANVASEVNKKFD